MRYGALEEMLDIQITNYVFGGCPKGPYTLPQPTCFRRP